MADFGGKILHVQIGKIISQEKSVLENVHLSKMGGCRRGVMMHLHHDTTLTVFHYRMARTQGGRIARPVAPPKGIHDAKWRQS